MVRIGDIFSYVDEIKTRGLVPVLDELCFIFLEILNLDVGHFIIKVDDTYYEFKKGELGDKFYEFESKYRNVTLNLKVPKNIKSKLDLLEVFSFVIHVGYKFNLDFYVRNTISSFLSFLKDNIDVDNIEFFESLASFMTKILEVEEVRIAVKFFDKRKVFVAESEKSHGTYNYENSLLNVELEIRGASFKIEYLEIFLNSLLLYLNLYLFKIDVTERLRYFSFFYNINNLFRKTADFRRRVEIALWALCCERGAFGFKEAIYLVYDGKDDVFRGFLAFRGELYKKLVVASVPDSSFYDPVDKIVVHVDVRDDEIMPLLKSLKDAFEISSSRAYLVPLFVENKLIGAFIVGSEYDIGSLTYEMLNHFADQCSLAFESAKVQELYRKTVEELRLAHETLEESERLKNLGEFVARVVHDIKNPLIAITGLAEKLYRKFPEDYPEKKILKMMMDEGKKLLDSLQDILTYVRKPTIKYEETDINELIDEVLFMEVYELRDKKIILVKELNRDLPKIRVDRAQIKRVIINIVKNAIQAMERMGGGVLRIRSAEEVLDNKRYLKIEVSDTGGGIPSEIVPNIFNPFFTTKSEGTGLGLSTSKRIVEMHGGFIRVDNDYPKGTTFEIYLPL
mgnify:CR=1 FL=1